MSGLLQGGNGTSGNIPRLDPGTLGASLLRLTGVPGQLSPISVTIQTRTVDGQIYPERSLVNLSAVVHWGNGVSGGDAVIDLARSTVFTVSAAWTLSVDVNYPGRSGFGAVQTGPAFFVEGCAVYGGAASIGPLRSDRLGGLAAGAIAPPLTDKPLPVPAYARRVRVVTSDAAARRDMVVKFYQDDVNGSLPFYESFQPQGDSGGRDDPIINGAEFFRVENINSTGNLTSVIAVWELAL